MPRSDKVEPSENLIQLAKENKTKLSDEIVKMVQRMQDAATEGKLKSEELFRYIAARAKDIKEALENTSVKERASGEKIKAAMKLIDDTNAAVIKKSEQALKSAVLGLKDFTWSLLNKENEAKMLEEEKHRKEESLKAADPIQPLINFVKKLQEQNPEPAVLITKIPEFLEQVTKISGDSLREKISIIHQMMMSKLNDMQQLLGAGEPKEESDKNLILFREAHKTLINVLAPAMVYTIVYATTSIKQEDKKELQAAIEQIKSALGRYAERKGGHVHESDYAEITAAMSKMKVVLQKVEKESNLNDAPARLSDPRKS